MRNIESNIGSKFLENDKKAIKEIEGLKNDIKEKHPEFLNLLEFGIGMRRVQTEVMREKYPKLLKCLSKSAKDAGFEDVVITRKQGGRIGVQPLFNLVEIEQAYLPTLEKLKDFAPDFLDKGLKQTLGNIKEETSGHEREHLKDKALKILPKEMVSIIKMDKLRRIEGNDSAADMILTNEIAPLKKKQEFYTETQRILKNSKNHQEAVESIATLEIFMALLDLGIRSKEDLEIEVDKKTTFKGLSESPNKDTGEIKGLFPYLKKDVINDVIDRENKIIGALKAKYEEKYEK